MEILNRNSRERAKWRVIALAVVVMVCNAVILWAMVNADSNFGVKEADEKSRTVADRIVEMRGKVNHSRNLKADLSLKKKEMKNKVNYLDTQRRNLLKEKKQLLKQAERLTSQ